MFAVVNHLHFTRPTDEFRASIEEAGAPLLASEQQRSVGAVMVSR